METLPTLYDFDGLSLEAGAILEPFGLPFLEADAKFLATAPLWRVDVDKRGWRTQPQRGGKFHQLTLSIAQQCRSWPSPVTDICDPTGRRFPEETPPEHRFYAV